MTVLVTGATGNIGKQVAAALVARGERVRALVRSPQRAALLPPGIEPVIGDLQDPARVEAALTGVSAALCVSPHDAAEERLAQIFVDACERLGVRLVFAGVVLSSRNPLQRWTIWALMNTLLPHYRGKLRIASRIARSRTKPVLFGVTNY
jgi:uncharacterized protein YbjT (DUF2867 family)